MGNRITIRIDDQANERLQELSQDTNLDISFLVREAIGKYLESKSMESTTLIPSERAVMPDEAFALVGPFRGWSGDLRVELRKRFLELLALANTTANHWPKSPGIRETYATLLSGCKHLRIGEQGGRHD